MAGINPLHGIPQYPGGSQKGKIPRVAKIADKTVKVYFAPGQTCSWYANPDNNFSRPNVYQAPVGWPKPNFVLGLPKVVQYFFLNNNSAATLRNSTWTSVGNQLKSQLESTYKNLFVLLPQRQPSGPSTLPMHAWPRWLTFVVPQDKGSPFLGVDVFNVMVVQDYGLTEGGPYSQYYDNPYGGEGGPTVPEPSPNYLFDTGGMRASFPNFRRFTTTMYNDVGIDPADTPGMVGAFPNINLTRKTWWNNVCTNGGAYGSVGMAKFDCHQGADVDCRTAVASLVSFFIGEVTAHFGL